MDLLYRDFYRVSIAVYTHGHLFMSKRVWMSLSLSLSFFCSTERTLVYSSLSLETEKTKKEEKKTVNQRKSTHLPQWTLQLSLESWEASLLLRLLLPLLLSFSPLTSPLSRKAKRKKRRDPVRWTACVPRLGMYLSMCERMQSEKNW